MATKDKRHDPPAVTFYSDDDNDNDEDIAEPSPCSSPSAHDVGNVFDYNDLRRGGPLSDNGASASAIPPQTTAQPQTKPCTAKFKGKNCKKSTPGDRYKGSKYECYLRRTSTRNYDANHVFCEECIKSNQCTFCEAVARRGKRPEKI